MAIPHWPARIPYQTWERVAQRAIVRTEGRSHLALRIMGRVVEARAQQDNEQFHLLIIDELLTRRSAAPGRFRYRIVPRLLAGPWHAFSWLLHLIHPAWSYRLNASFEDHAEHEYMHFVALDPELDHQPVVCDAADGYGRFDTLGDLLRQIGHDERVHKLEGLAAHERLQPSSGHPPRRDRPRLTGGVMTPPPTTAPTSTVQVPRVPYLRRLGRAQHIG